jgi:serpin B
MNLKNLVDTSGNFYLRSCIHKTIINVYENGTEAAAATGIISSLPMGPPPTLYVDQSFFYMIIDRKHDFIHYMGILYDPI